MHKDFMTLLLLSIYTDIVLGLDGPSTTSDVCYLQFLPLVWFASDRLSLMVFDDNEF